MNQETDIENSFSNSLELGNSTQESHHATSRQTSSSKISSPNQRHFVPHHPDVGKTNAIGQNLIADFPASFSRTQNGNFKESNTRQGSKIPQNNGCQNDMETDDSEEHVTFHDNVWFPNEACKIVYSKEEFINHCNNSYTPVVLKQCVVGCGGVRFLLKLTSKVHLFCCIFHL